MVRVIDNGTSKTLLYHCKDPVKARVLLLGPTGISAVNAGRTTIHSDFGIKPGTKILGLNEKSKVALRKRSSEVAFLTTDELSMTLSDLWIYIDAELGKTFMMIHEKIFTVVFQL